MVRKSNVTGKTSFLQWHLCLVWAITCQCQVSFFEGSPYLVKGCSFVSEMLFKFTETEKLEGRIYACEQCNSKLISPDWIWVCWDVQHYIIWTKYNSLVFHWLSPMWYWQFMCSVRYLKTPTCQKRLHYRVHPYCLVFWRHPYYFVFLTQSDVSLFLYLDRRRSVSPKPTVLTEVTKQLLIHRLPPVLRLHLKRFM